MHLLQNDHNADATLLHLHDELGLITYLSNIFN